MSNAFEALDSGWNPIFMQPRNLTAWVDEKGRLSMALGTLTVKRRLDIHANYDAFDTSTSCVVETDITRSNKLKLEFYNQEKSHFGSITNTYSHFFYVFYRCL